MREIKFRANIKNTPIIIDGFALYDSGMIGMHPEALEPQLPDGYSHCSDSNSLLHGEDLICEIIQGDEWIFIDRKDIEIIQYTGLKDSAGKEIYEGDIVEAILNYHGKPSGIKFKAKIIYNENIGSFQISYLNINNIFVNDTIWLKYFLTVIGNIYETPELLTQNKEEK